jgi:glycosyltransferase involved in cell wall biosynthesis
VVDGEGVVASLVEPSELRDPAARAWPPADPDAIRLVWAGRLVGGKGLEGLVGAVELDRRLSLDIVGDGPDRARLRWLADASGARDITWAGHIADRAAYLDRLAAADVFVFPSPAEGFPKVVLDAFAVGLPVVATRAGGLGELADAGLIEPIARPDAASIAAALDSLRAREPSEVVARRDKAHAFASRHTRPAEAARLVEHWRGWWPDLPWER